MTSTGSAARGGELLGSGLRFGLDRRRDFHDKLVLGMERAPVDAKLPPRVDAGEGRGAGDLVGFERERKVVESGEGGFGGLRGDDTEKSFTPSRYMQQRYACYRIHVPIIPLEHKKSHFTRYSDI
jgi:hypothetical protein